jgi:hypothetical protein
MIVGLSVASDKGIQGMQVFDVFQAHLQPRHKAGYLIMEMMKLLERSRVSTHARSLRQINRKSKINLDRGQTLETFW